MSENNFKYKAGDRVRLKMDRAEVYPRAFGGSEGVVTGTKLDSLGHHNMVYVEWDKGHWTYNGEHDMWAFEDHFEPVEEMTMQEPPKDFMSELQNLIKNFQEKPGESPNDEETTEAEFVATLKEATDLATQGEAFILATVNRERNPNDGAQSVLIPQFFSFYKSEEAGILIESQIARAAALAHQELAVDNIQRILKKRNEES